MKENDISLLVILGDITIKEQNHDAS
jgi:hypothetical protein